MANWTKRDLEKQFERCQRDGWSAFFQEGSTGYDFPVAVLMAVASRETNIRNIIGDGGHGYGIMQIDDRSFPDWCHSGVWKDPRSAILKGVQVLDGKREDIINNQGKRIRFAGTTFVGKDNLTQDEILRTSLAGYNSGWWAYYNLSVKGDPDLRTTGKNYSSDTLQRAAIFQSTP